MELFATIGNGRASQPYYLHVAVVTQPSLKAKLKLDENGHALKLAPDTISCFVGMLRFFKNANLFHFEN